MNQDILFIGAGVNYLQFPWLWASPRLEDKRCQNRIMTTFYIEDYTILLASPTARSEAIMAQRKGPLGIGTFQPSSCAYVI